MARKNPTTSKATPPSPVEGVDRLPLPIGINMKALEQAEEMPGHGAISASSMSMKPNDGDNPSYGDAPFANGTSDISHAGGPSAAPAPGKVGA